MFARWALLLRVLIAETDLPSMGPITPATSKGNMIRRYVIWHNYHAYDAHLCGLIYWATLAVRH